jgi:lipopolysaccharide biosynthesis glycosyltransferase
MDIALCHDEYYAPYAATVMASIMENNKGEDVVFHLICDGISMEKQALMQSWIASHHCHIKFYTVQIDDFVGFPFEEDARLHYGAYFRLYLAEALKDLDRVIYLDCDLIVNESLIELWNTDISDYALAGVRDRTNDYIHVFNRLRYPLTDGYINSGVLLIDLRRWRDDHFFEQAKALAKKMPLALKNHDQDIINAIYHGQIKMLDFKYNLLEYFLYVEEWFNMDRKYYPQIIQACKTPVIIHFCLPVKPWHYECTNPFKTLYYKYRAMTPWPEVKLIHRKEKLTPKLKLKRILGKLGLYHIETKPTLRKDINVIEEPDNVLF